MQRGRVIVFEGLDYTGKTTQSNNLHNYLNKHGQISKLFKFPTYDSPTGQVLKQYHTAKIECPSRVSHLLHSANRFEFDESIKNNINNGIHVIIDRFNFSGLAYSYALMKTRGSQEPDYEWLQHTDRGLVRSDIVIYLNVPLDQLEKRRFKSETLLERYENNEMQKYVSQGYKIIASNNKDIWYDIDANHNADHVFSIILNLITRKFTEPLKALEILGQHGP